MIMILNPNERRFSEKLFGVYMLINIDREYTTEKY